MMPEGATMSFEFDISQPVPGPYREPRDGERRTRLYLENHWQDCTDLAELNPDLAQYTDATMRLLAASWRMRELLREIVKHGDDFAHEPLGGGYYAEMEEILEYIEKGTK